MDELQAIRNFRGDVPAWGEDARHAARSALLSHIAAPSARFRRARRGFGHASSRRHPRSWPRLAVVTAVLLLAGLTAASALAIYDFVVGEPAPTPIAEQLAEEGRADPIIPFFAGIPDVVAKSAHSVAAIKTSGGRAILWAVTAEPGPVCYFVEFETLTRRTGQPRGEAICGTRLSSAVPVAYNVSRANVGRRQVVTVVGWVHDNVASVLLRAPDGTEREVALSERFFIAEVRVEKAGDGNSHTLIAKDAAGATLQRIELHLRSSNLPVVPKSMGTKRTVIETRDSRGRPMSLTLVPVEGGRTCLRFETANGMRVSCPPETRVEEGIGVHPTLLGSLVYFSGSVGPEVAKLELHYEDGSMRELPLVERFVLYDVPRERFAKGKRPTLLLARTADGAEVDRRTIAKRLYFGIRREGDVSP